MTSGFGWPACVRLERQTSTRTKTAARLQKTFLWTWHISRAGPGASLTVPSFFLGNTLKRLLVAKLSSSSLSTYRRPWYLYKQFHTNRLQIQVPILTPLLNENLALFIAYQAVQKYATSTVLTYISASGFPHRLAGLPDPTIGWHYTANTAGLVLILLETCGSQFRFQSL